MAPSNIKRPAQQISQQSTKKRRLSDSLPGHDDGPSIDPLEEDIGVGASRKKNVNLDGYETDSSDEGHGVKRAPDLGDETGPVDDDDDMFGEAPSTGAVPVMQDRKKLSNTEQYQVQGEELGTHSEFMDIVDEGSQDEEDDDEESVDEEVGALGRKKNAPKMDGFHMRAEIEEGFIDADGNYIRKAKDEKDNQDNWLKDVSRKDIEAARQAVEKREREAAEKSQEEDDTSVADLLAELITHLSRGETLLECLSRLGSASKSNTKQSLRRKQNKKGKDALNKDVAVIERLTALASQLMGKTQIDVYDTEREGLARAYKRETGQDLPLPSTTDNIMKDDDDDDTNDAENWEFVWTGAEEEVHGPYDSSTMKAWLEEGALSSDGNQALVRRVGEIAFVEASMAVFDG